jgi:small subunit ribosomal protein S19e
MKPAKFYKGSGKIVRMILQQAEKAGLVEKVKGKRAGRQLTAQGRALVEEVR